MHANNASALQNIVQQTIPGTFKSNNIILSQIQMEIGCFKVYKMFHFLILTDDQYWHTNLIDRTQRVNNVIAAEAVA